MQLKTDLVEVAVGEDGELLLDRIQYPDGAGQIVIYTSVRPLHRKPHHPRLRLKVVSPRRVPSIF